MISNTTSNTKYWSVVVILAAGVLTACDYCQPLLLASLIGGGLYKVLTLSLFSLTAQKKLHN